MFLMLCGNCLKFTDVHIRQKYDAKPYIKNDSRFYPAIKCDCGEVVFSGYAISLVDEKEHQEMFEEAITNEKKKCCAQLQEKR